MTRIWGRGQRSSARGAAARRLRHATLQFESLESRLAMTGVVINEFLASNVDGLVDQDGEHSDWIELKNTSAAPVDLTGWHLTDASGNLDKWTLPATVLAPGGRLTIFASEKDRVVAGQELHTNFKLAVEGEYLALVAADGTTVVDAFAPYPPQRDDVSYGPGTDPAVTSTETLVGASSPLGVISPSAENAAVDDHWREIGFNDSAWLSGTRSIGFDRDATIGNNGDFTPYIGRTLTTGEMPSTRYTAYVRYAFNLANKGQLTSLTLNVRFDDGIIASLNGREMLRINLGEDFVFPQPVWNSRAGYRLPGSSQLQANNRGVEAITPVTFDLTPYLPSLVEGANVLTFHVVNGTNSTPVTDFLLEPVLTATRSSGSQTGYMTGPTPGGENGVTTLGFVGDTHFSVDRGFFDAPIQVAIAADTPTASIRYTTDGSLPSPTYGTLYTGPVDVATTTILRAIAYQSGYTSSNVDTQTYIFLADVIGQSASDVTQPYATWGNSKDGDTLTGYHLEDESDWAMDPDVVNANLATIIADLKAIPSVSLAMNWNDLFGGTPMPGTPAPAAGFVAPAPQGIYINGSSSERYASFEYFNPATPTDQVHADVAVEMQGHSSTTRWNTDKMSFQVKFKYPYGDTELNYPLFAGSPDGANAASEFDTLILDAGFNYGWTHNNAAQRNFARFVTDQVVADLQNLASGGGQAPHGKFVHLYLNGLYWGLYNMHERPDDSFAAEYFGGDKDDYYVVKATPDSVKAYSYVEGGVTAEAAYGAMVAATNSPASFAAIAAQIDVDQFIDYMIVHYYAGGGADWSENNWYATKEGPSGKWRFHAWDQEHAFPTTDNGDAWTQTTDITNKDEDNAPTGIHRNLVANEEYKLRFADRVQALLHNGGLLTDAAARAAYEVRANEIDRAIIGESARWGDNRVANDPYTRDDFLAIKKGVLNTFFPARTAAVLGHFDARLWIPTLDAPLFSQYGGEVATGYSLSMTEPAGTPASGDIWYTLDGSDPRLAGGAISPLAVKYVAPVSLTSATQVKARVFADTSGTFNDWSPLIDATFVTPQTFPLRIVELNYNPNAQPGVPVAEDLEYIELLNTGPTTIGLDGVQIAGFASTPYTFANGLTLAAGARIVVARAPAAFTQFYGAGIYLAPTGYATANLSNGGEQVVLLGPVGEELQKFAYSDDPPWPTAADGDGRSLEIVDPLGDPTLASNWRASYLVNGSPGVEGLPPTGLAGDFDGNDQVDGNDFLLWQRGLGTTAPNATPANGDADGDKDVDAVDLGLWADAYGEAPMVAAAVRAAAVLADETVTAEPSVEWPAGAWIVADSPRERASAIAPARERAFDAVHAAAAPRGAYRPALVAVSERWAGAKVSQLATDPVDFNLADVLAEDDLAADLLAAGF